MLRPFEIHEPATVAEASRLLARLGEQAAVYAGGTELLLLMKEGLAHFPHLVNIKTIGGLDAIAFEDGVLRLGAVATHREIETSPAARQHAPLVARVASQVGNLRVRAAGTIGGNLCFAEPHSDPAAVLVAWDATLVLARAGGERCVPAAGFFLGMLQTAREPDEILTAVEVRPLPPGTGAAYHRFALHERPTAAVAAVVTVRDGAVAAARVVVGSVGPVPVRVPEAEDALAGRRPEGEVLRAAAEVAGRRADVLEDMFTSTEYKRHLVSLLAARALHDAVSAARTAH
ncbi:MAG: FAD binding domain-containing protein [Armatimonadetes bacterium]|nr:FAD binding domain-containing protein [Armatimonadota bacterium]